MHAAIIQILISFILTLCFALSSGVKKIIFLILGALGFCMMTLFGRIMFQFGLRTHLHREEPLLTEPVFMEVTAYFNRFADGIYAGILLVCLFFLCFRFCNSWLERKRVAPAKPAFLFAVCSLIAFIVLQILCFPAFETPLPAETRVYFDSCAFAARIWFCISGTALFLAALFSILFPGFGKKKTEPPHESTSGLAI